MESRFCSRKMKVKNYIYTQAIIKGDFNKGDIISIPIKKKRKIIDDGLFLSVSYEIKGGITALQENMNYNKKNEYG